MDRAVVLTLNNLLEQKLDLFRKFLEATVTIKKAVEEDGNQDIASLVEKRRQWMEVIDKIDERLKKISSDNERSIFSFPSPGSSFSIQNLLETIEETAMSANIVDQEVQAIMLFRQQDLGKRIASLSFARQGLKGYSGGNPNPLKPRFLSVKS